MPSRGCGLAVVDGCAGRLAQPVLPQTVKRADFAGQRTERSRLNIFLVRHLFHLQIVVANRFALGADLVKTRCFQQHAAIGAGHPGDREKTDHCRRDKDIGVVQGDGDLAQFAVFLTGHKNDVVAFAQRSHSKGEITLSKARRPPRLLALCTKAES